MNRLHDSRGLVVATSSHEALAAFERAMELTHGYFNDPIAVADEAIAHDPSFVMPYALKAGLMAMGTDRSLHPAIKDILAAAQPHLRGATERERAHVAAVRAWLDGDFAGSQDIYGRIVIDSPRDSLALQFAHIQDFFRGQSTMLRDRVAAALPAWDESTPGFGYVLGMYAFGLEEGANYPQAEEAGRRALALNQRDPWAVHAVAHVFEMQGRTGEGVAWLTERQADWSENNGFAYHNWWHLALYQLEIGDTQTALELYDARIRPQKSNVILEMLDASALLWRLHLRGVSVGARWLELADSWEAMADQGHYAFNDAHAMMAFAATGRADSAARATAALERSAAGGGTNAGMAREVGLPLARALWAFAEGEYGAAAETLLSIRAFANRFGGSHAQRDIIGLTALEAALRGGDRMLARALAAERAAVKPTSPFNQALWRRATTMPELRNAA
jgi:tetratricopeptide (TPR) repeat protein